MILRDQDFRLVTLSQRLGALNRVLADLETDFVARRLDSVTIDRPVFLTGLARSGSTILLTLLAQADGVATHRYRDFPFLQIPFLWNWFQDRFASQSEQVPQERAHADRIEITPESPEAFEEPLWQNHFDWLHDAHRVHVLDESVTRPDFEDAFRTHLRKILALRGGARYLSKGNYNVTRIKYLTKLFPDARFVVPIREPIAHVHSLVRQHRRFCRLALEDARVPQYLRAAGHYEFGSQRVPVNVSAAEIGRIEAAWHEGDDHRGYARQWAAIYRYVDMLRSSHAALADRITIIRYEDLCSDPRRALGELLAATSLSDRAGRVVAAATAVAAPSAERSNGATAVEARAVWDEVAATAAIYGYDQGPGSGLSGRDGIALRYS
jgi:sulfotransferase family protein